MFRKPVLHSIKLLFTLFLGNFFVIQIVAQVGLQTGTPEINIPLYSYSDARNNLATSVSLSYVGGNGIKANDIASAVGTGWDLAVGGAITRIQNGEPDDQKFVDLNTIITLPDRKDKLVYGLELNVKVNHYYPNGYLYTDVSPSTSITDKVTYNPLFPLHVFREQYKPNSEDREQDLFVFRFNGQTGKFVIGKDRSVLLLEDRKLKVEFTETDMTGLKIRTRINKFKITDETGIEYIFDEMEVDDNLIPGYNTEIGGFSGNEMTGTADQPTKVVSKWFLTEIKNPLTGKKVTISYTTCEMDLYGAKTAVRQIQPDLSTQYSENIRRTKAAAKKINYILTPDNQKVQFNYSNIERIDLNDDYPLQNISVYQNDIFKYGYNFKYGYLLKKEIKNLDYSFQSAELRYARLCLKSISRVEKQGLELSPHLFEYHLIHPYYDENYDYMQRGTPARFTYAADYWGYNNGEFGMEDADGKWLYHTTIGPQQVFPMLGLIKKVVYPEGGYLEYQYANNRAENSPYQYNSQVGGLSGGVRVHKTIYHDGISHGNDIEKEYSYLKEDGTSSMWGFEMPVVEHTKEIRVYKQSGQVFLGIFSKENAYSFQADFGKFVAAVGLYIVTNNILTGGFDPYSIIIGILISIFIEIITPDYKDYTYPVWSNVNMVLKNPLPAQYERVEVKEKDNGSTIYEFTSPSFHPLIAPVYSFPYSAKPRAASWLYGLPKTIFWKDEEGNLIRKIENEYLPVVNTSTNSNFLSVKWEVTRSIYASFDEDPTTTASNFVTSESYYPVSGHVKLLETKETTFHSNGQPVIAITKYTYTDHLQIRTVEKINSQGGSDGVTYYYPQDYTSPDEYTYITNMKQENMHSIPIVAASWIREDATAGPRKTTKTVVTKYASVANGAIKPESIFINERFHPQAGSYSDNPPVLSPLVSNSLYGFKNTESLLYDDHGNLVQQTVYGKPGSKIFDHNGSLLIAEASNATFDQIAYTSFEADGKGNWTFSGSPVENADAITGKRVYNLSSGSITKSVNNAETYIVSYWRPSSLSGLTISGTQTGYPLVSQAISGWKYYEHKISGVGTVTLSGSGMIDEVRVHPSSATMASYTHDPLIGITTRIGLNGNLIYNEYDNFGRLVLVRDRDKNIVRKICYNYAGQEESCQTYGNQLQSHYIRRNNCTGCFVGSYVTYTVPADTYFAGSQAAANTLAQNDISANAQIYANANGACTAPPNAVVNVVNNAFEYVSITFTNTCTSATFNYTAYPGSSTSFGPFPEGIYNISMQSPEPETFIINGYSQSGVSTAYFYNIQILGSASITIND